jgi:subtilisin family serine protease
MQARSLTILPWAAILALPFLATAPASQSRAATQPSQATQPFDYNRGGPPVQGNNQPFNPPVVNSNPGDNGPPTSQGNSSTRQPRENSSAQTTPRITLPLTPSDSRANTPPVILRNDRRDYPQFEIPFAPPFDPRGRPPEFSNLPPRFIDPPFTSRPDNFNLQDQIEQLGSVPYTPPNPPELQFPTAGASVAIAPPVRVIRPPVALPNRRAGSAVPPANERRLVPDEVVVEVAAATTPQAIAALEQRNRLTRLDQLLSQLSGTNLLRERIQDGRSVAVVVGALENDAAVMSAQPNYLFTLQQLDSARRETSGEALQYALVKLRLPQAHQLATGSNVLVAVIDSGIDTSHPEIKGAIADTFDTLDGSGTPHSHGTAIAGLIAAHARLTGAAPAARILAVRAFSASPSAEGSTFNILKGLDWAAVKGARVINLSFAGPQDPAIHRSLEGAFRNGIVLVAAAGNAGPKSPPLYPGADPSVIAVTATDAGDKFFAASNRGRYIAVAAPGVDILVAAPGGRYQISSGTSFSAAEISGIAALMIERKPDLTPDGVRRTLLSTGRPIPPQRQGAQIDARLADAYQALSASRVLPVAIR